eukprot:scaffold29315_cov35-Tisochrysis_lutea.AAC.5
MVRYVLCGSKRATSLLSFKLGQADLEGRPAGRLHACANTHIVHFLQASGARPVVVRRRSDHCGERLAHLLELSSDVLLDVNTEVIAVRDSGRLEHQPELCLLEVVDCERGLLSHEQGCVKMSDTYHSHDRLRSPTRILASLPPLGWPTGG